MGFIRFIARPILAAPFIMQGISAARKPAEKRHQVENVGVLVGASAEDISDSKKDMLVRGIGATQAAAGILLSLGKFQKLSGAALALTQIPVALGENPLWAVEDEDATKVRTGLVSSIALAGGALLAVTDNKGRPSFRYRFQAWRDHRSDIRDVRRNA